MRDLAVLSLDDHSKSHRTFITMQWNLDLADTGLAENLGLKDTLQKIWAAIFDF